MHESLWLAAALTAQLLPLTSWKFGDEACVLSIDLHKASGSSDSDAGDADACGQARVKFKESDHAVLWSAVLEWAVNAKVHQMHDFVLVVVC